MKYNLRTENGYDFVQEGRGQDSFVFHHGLLANADSFSPQVQYFRKHFNVFGLNVGYKEKINKAGYLEKTASFIKEKVLPRTPSGRIHVLGNSMGGIPTMTLANDFKDNVASYALINPSVLGDDIDQMGVLKSTDKNAHGQMNEILREIANTNFQSLKKRILELNILLEGASNQTLKNAMVQLLDVFGIKPKEGFTAKTYDLMLKFLSLVHIRKKQELDSRAIRKPLMNIMTLMKEVKDFKFSEEYLKNIKQPGIGIFGSGDLVTPPSKGEEFKTLVGGPFEMHILNTGHASMMEKPNQVNKLLEDFYRNQGFIA